MRIDSSPMSSIFIIDSGSTLHTTVSDEAILINKRPSTRKATGATGATGTEIRFMLVGDVQLTTEEYLIITDVHCSSQIVVNVIRVLLILRTKQSSEIKKLFARCPTITNYTTSAFKTPKSSQPETMTTVLESPLQHGINVWDMFHMTLSTKCISED